MGYDRLVDSAKHDAALTTTANSIRAKTGGAGKIEWNAMTGFADAIASLVGAKTGTFTPTYSGGNITISGLGFKPSTVLLFALSDDYDDYNLEGDCLYAIFDGINTKSLYAWASYDEETDEDENGEPYTSIFSYMVVNTGDEVNITVNDDGFVVISADDGWSGALSRDHSYKYYAF